MKGIADGPAILVRETAREFGVEEHIRFGHKVVRAEWSSPERPVDRHGGARGRRDADADVRLPVHVLGLLPLRPGYTAEFPGIEDFGGQVVHPQHWPEDLDYDGKRVVVIGSGATAVTLVPAMADRAAHVTMLQRTPTYIAPLPSHDLFARAGRSPVAAGDVQLVRWKNILRTIWSYQLSRRRPDGMKRTVRFRAGEVAAEGLRHRHPLPRRRTTRGTSASASSRTAICSRAFARARRRSSRRASTASSRTASASRTGRCSRPTSWSPRRG